jgi:hypothetical protein
MTPQLVGSVRWRAPYELVTVSTGPTDPAPYA